MFANCRTINSRCNIMRFDQMCVCQQSVKEISWAERSMGFVFEPQQQLIQKYKRLKCHSADISQNFHAPTMKVISSRFAYVSRTGWWLLFLHAHNKLRMLRVRRTFVLTARWPTDFFPQKTNCDIAASGFEQNSFFELVELWFIFYNVIRHPFCCLSRVTFQ